MKTITLLLLLTALALTGCASSPKNTEIQGYRGLVQLSQQQVIQQSLSCTQAHMRASVEYIQQQYTNGSVSVPVQVNCYPGR
jgi:starvation-inducible outer membrane lipoprotein